MSQTEEISGAVRDIIRAHKSTLDARRSLSEHRGTKWEQMKHRELHEEVKNYFETMLPYLEKRVVSDHWEGSEKYHLWSVEYDFVDLKRLPSVDWEGDADSRFILVEELPEEYIVEDLHEFVVTESEYVGLEELVGEFDQVEERTETYSDALGTHTETWTEVLPLPIDLLVKTARLLDRAAEAMGVLGEVDDEPPKTSIDKDLMEKFAGRLADIRKEGLPGTEGGMDMSGDDN